MNYKIQHITNKRKIIRNMNPTTLTIHSTGNLKSTAQNERDNLNRPGNTSSTGFHVAVDDKQAIECIPFNKVAYHAGDGANGKGNSTSIGLEICESGNRQKTLENAVKVTAKIFNEKGWGVDRLRRHFDWSGKSCPRILMANNWAGWHKFKQDVQVELNKLNTPSKPQSKPTIPSSNKNELFRVQTGAFGNKNNATSLSNKLKKDGYNTYLVKVGILYKVQVGAFGVRANADTLANELKKKGYSTFITTESGEAVSESKTTPQSIPPKTQSKPKANLTVDGIWGSELTKALQKEFGTPVDGIISGQYNNATTRPIYSVKFGVPYTGSTMIKALQRKLKVTADGFIGEGTVKALQRYLGTPADGVISRPSTVVRELQKRLNAGTF